MASVINTRHEIAKARGWKDAPPSKAEFTKAVLEENNLLRRPITIRGKRVAIGSDEEGLRALLGE